MADEKKTRKVVRADKEFTVILKGERYHALLIPESPVVEIDFSDCPEDDPLRRQRNIDELTKVRVDRDRDLEYIGNDEYRLTPEAAKRLLESL